MTNGPENQGREGGVEISSGRTPGELSRFGRFLGQLSGELPFKPSEEPERITITKSSAEATVTLAQGLSPSQRREVSRLFAGVASEPVPARLPNPLVWDPTGGEVEGVQASFIGDSSASDSCGLGFAHEFIRALSVPLGGSEARLCPERHEFLSKDASGSGWIRVEGATHLPTVTRQPAPNAGNTLLLDSESLQALALRSGIGIAKGAGILVGPVPEGYRVGFAGRAEEPEVFEANGRRYFVILNAEPGAGVVELSPEGDPGTIATVFAPVLGDVVTYLDLSRPVPASLDVKVVKSGRENDPETRGLSVAWSMQNGIRAITRSDGTARLDSLSIIPGFPVYLDVGAMHAGESGFLYRYEIKNPLARKLNLLPQIPERHLSRWLSQINTGLSDQAALIVGSFKPSTLSRLPPPYRVRTDSLTPGSNLEPRTFTLHWNGRLSEGAPLDPLSPRYLSVQVSEGLGQIRLMTDEGKPGLLGLLPVSPRVIHVVFE
jgi:hypothetical protein